MTIIDPGTTQQTPAADEPSGIAVPLVTEVETPPAQTQAPAKIEDTPIGKTFTKEDIEKARKEEKDKLYKSIEDMKAQLALVAKEREDREKSLKDQAKAAEAEAKKKAEEEMSAKELLAQKEQEWEQRFQGLEQQRQRSEALLEQERKFAGLMDYRARRLQDEAEEIMPELIDFINGSSEDEIEQAIATAKAKTEKILGNVMQAQQNARQQMPGTKVTAPATGPLESQASYETLSADDIRGMDMATYAKRRQSLLGAASENRNKGLFG